MKNRILNVSLFLMITTLMLLSAIAGPANADELLPEACGGAAYSGDEADLGESTVDETIDGTQGEVPAEDGTETENLETTPQIQTEVVEQSEAEEAAKVETETAEQSEAEEAAKVETETAEQSEAEDAVKAEQSELEPVDQTANDSEAAKIPELNGEHSASNLFVCAVAGPGLEATAVPHPHPYDPDEDAIRYKHSELHKTVGDVIIKVGESVIPFGHSISDFIRSRSVQGKDMDKGETLIDLAADTAGFACPIGAPLVSVAKDIILKIYHLF